MARKLLITFALLIVVAPSTLAQGQPGAATVVSLKGSLTARQPRGEVRTLRLQQTVSPGDELATGEDSEAVIRMPDGSTVRVFPDSRLIFNERSADITEWLHLWLGSIKLHIQKLTGRPNPHKLSTPSAVIAVRGTTFSVFVDEMSATLVAVDEGLVGVANARWPDEEVLLTAGQRSWIRPDERPMQAQRFRGRSEVADLIPMRSGAAMAHRPMDTAASRGHAATGTTAGRMGNHR